MLCAACSSGRVLLKVEGEGGGKNLLEPSAWKPGDLGFQTDTSVSHSGTGSIRLENSSPQDMSQAFQQVTLNQKVPRTIRATALSKAEDVGPAARGNYALYLDIQYTDGSWVWGQIADFASGTHDWQEGEVLFAPEKPIKVVSVNLLLRRCAGKAWFDDCRLEEITASDGRALFDNVVVRKLSDPQKLDGHPGGFYVRDVAANSDFLGSDECSSLGLKLDAKFTTNKDYVRADCEVTDLTGKDRAVTVSFVIPMPAEGLRWWHSIRSSERVAAEGAYTDSVPIEAGLGSMSKYPFSCLSSAKESVCLGIPMSEPCVYRIGCNGALGWYYIAFDLGLCPEVPCAKFSFIIYKTDPGMRAAADKYYRIFPEYFTKRAEREGNWMAFTKVSSVKGWEDFGFAFHEGDNDVAWDAEHGICAFRYTEPMSYWMSMTKDVQRTPEKALEMIDADSRQDKDIGKRNWALATKSSLEEDDSGRQRILFFDAPWCDGALFLLNPNPRIPGTTKASISWSKEIADRLYGDPSKPQLAGEYLDSVEMASGYVNTRRDQLKYAIRPLTFCRRTKAPAALQILSTYEFARFMEEDVHRRGKLLMANGVPDHYGFMAHLFDVLGIETNWLADGKYNPMPDEGMDFRRTLCRQKPYCFLMNTDYEKFDHSMVEKYFQRCLFWGVFPGFFSANAATNCYFDNPALYDRDRDLFKKYLPLIQKIARAGWEPLTMARCSGADIERFGPGKDGTLYFTIRGKGSKAVLTLDPKLGKPVSAVKLPADQPLAIKSTGIEVPLDEGEEAVVEIRRK